MTLISNSDEQVDQTFIQEALECLEHIEQLLPNLKQNSSVPELEELVRAAHTIKGGAVQLSLTDIQTLAHRLEKIFRFRSLSQEKFETDWELLDLLLQAYKFLQLSLQTEIAEAPKHLELEVDSGIEEELTSSSIEEIFTDLVPSRDLSVLPQNRLMPVTSMAAPSPVQPPEMVRKPLSEEIELPQLSASIPRENPTDKKLANLPPHRELRLKTSKLMVWQADLTILVLPYDKIEDNLSADSDQIIYSNQQRFLSWRGQMIRVYQLSELLSYNYPLSQTNPSQVSRGAFSQKNRVVSRLVIREGQFLFALESPIDRLVTESELTIQPLGSALASPKYIYGCMILANELALPAIDLAALLHQFFGNSNQSSTATQLLDAPETETIPRTVANTTSSSNVTDRVPTVLVVDNSLSWRHSLSVNLQKAGYQVLQAQDGREGIEQLQQNSTIQLVISEIEMPNLNGFGFLSYCRKDPLLSKVPVILLSTCSSKQHLQLAKYLGATAYFTKPYKELEFLESIQTILSSGLSRHF